MEVLFGPHKTLWHPLFIKKLSVIEKSSYPFSSHYSQIDLSDVYKVTGVATQGGDGLSEWVTSYKLQYTVDDSTWQYYSQVSDSSSQRLSNGYQNFIVVFLHHVITISRFQFVSFF